MSLGNYGSIRGATIDPQRDANIYYSFAENRYSLGTEWSRLDSSILEETFRPEDNTIQMGGAFRLRLPTSVFNTKGYYCVLIDNSFVRTTITDCGVLASLPNVRGLVFDISTIDVDKRFLFTNDGLIGFRIEYLNANDDNKLMKNKSVIITSSNLVEPIAENLSNTNQKSIRYRLNDNSNLLFVTVTPASSSNVKPNVFPFIGNPSQEVLIYNTYFTPIMLNIDLVEHDIESLAYVLYGNQTKDCDTGIRTIYNFDNDIYRQFNEFIIKNDLQEPTHEVRQIRDNIDFNQDFNIIINT